MSSGRAHTRCWSGRANAGAQRIRGSKLQRIRARVLRAQPLCAKCLAKGRIKAATEVDHVIALFNGGTESEFDDSNRQALCAACHALKTAMDLGQRRRPRIGADGYPVDER